MRESPNPSSSPPRILTSIEKLASFVSQHEWMPDTRTVSFIRDAFIDSLGCVLIGARQPVAINTLTTLSAWGSGRSNVFGTGRKLGQPWAAMANATAGHALDYDDWEIPGNTHASIVIFPALWAIIDAMDRPVSGREVIDAYLSGFEVIGRIGEAVNFDHYAQGWHATATLGAIGSSAAVARLLRLDAKQTTHALAISVSQAVGYTNQFGSDAKPLQAGFAAKTGVVAASLAQNGLSGQPGILESAQGFNHLMAHGDQDRYAAVFADASFPKPTSALSEYGVVVKPYPSCGYTHRVIDCAIKLRATPGFDPAQIKTVVASLPDFHAAIVPFKQPMSQAEALFSVPFCVALTLLGRTLTSAEIEAEAWNEPAVKSLISKVTKVVRKPLNPKLNYDPADPDWVEVTLQDGQTIRTEVVYPLGDPHNRMSSDAILQKFLLNAQLNPASFSNYSTAIDVLAQWDNQACIRSVMAPFGGTNS